MPWWEWVVGQLALNGAELDPQGDVLRRLQSSPNRGSFPKFRDYNGLLLALKTKVEDLAATRKDLNRRLQALTDNPSEEEIRKNSACGVCKKDWGKTGPECGICQLEKFLSVYESKLYSYRKQGDSQVKGLSMARALEAGTEVVSLGKGKKLEVWKGTTSGNAYQEPCEAHRLLYTTLFAWLRQQAGKRKAAEPEWQRALEEATAESKIKDVLERYVFSSHPFYPPTYPHTRQSKRHPPTYPPIHPRTHPPPHKQNKTENERWATGSGTPPTTSSPNWTR